MIDHYDTFLKILLKSIILIPISIICVISLLFIIGISRVDARENYSVSTCWFGGVKKPCNTGFDISDMQGKSVAIDINKVASGTLSFHATLTMHLWNWQSGDTVNVSGAYAFGNASYTCDSSNGCYIYCPTNVNWANCEMWIDTFHPNNDEKITAVFYLNGNTFNRTFLANATGSAWIDSSTGNLTNGGFNSSMNNQTNTIVGNQDKNKDEIIDNQNKNQQQTNEKLDGINDALTDDSVPDIDLGGVDIGNDSPISTLLTLPINIFTHALDGANKSCKTYSFGSILGTEWHLDCIDGKKILGDNIWGLIDMFGCFFMIYNIIMLIVQCFETITGLKDGFDSLYVPQHEGYATKHGGGARV